MKIIPSIVLSIVCAVVLAGCADMKLVTVHWRNNYSAGTITPMRPVNAPVPGCPGITTDAGTCYVQGGAGFTRGAGGIQSGGQGPTAQPYVKR